MDEQNIENQPIQGVTVHSKKKREDKIRRRDIKALDNVLKSFVSTPENLQFDALKSKYGELYEEYRNVQNILAATEKRLSVLQKENDQLQSDQSKSVLARSRLESLCRELQRQNKLIKEENVAKIREEEERRKEVAAKFQATLNDVNVILQENNEKNIKLRDDNLEMSNKISTLCEQFQKREQQVVRMGKQMDLEKQLCDATLNKVQLEFKAEREMWNKERESNLEQLQKSEEARIQMQSKIKSLEEHLQLYTGKYEEFESTISKSNQVFDNCKSAMIKMTAQIAKLEKDLKISNGRSKKHEKNVIELSQTNDWQNSEIMASRKKIQQLQKLCRQLQIDRSSYLKLLKANGIEATSQTCLDTAIPSPPELIAAVPNGASGSPVQAPASPTATRAPITKKEHELLMLKENLKVLQEQYTNLNIDDAEENEILMPVEPTTILPVTDDIIDNIIGNNSVTDFIDAHIIQDAQTTESPTSNLDTNGETHQSTS